MGRWLLVAFVLAFSAPAHADAIWYTYAVRQRECDSFAYDPEVSIRGCTMIIRSNNITGLHRAATLRQRAQHYLAINDEDRALADYTASLRLDAEAGSAYFNRGEIYLNRGEFDAAAADFTQLIRLQPSRMAGYLGRCRALISAPETASRARADCDEALTRARPEHRPIALGMRGFVGLRMGEYEAAWSDYNAALELAPMDAYFQYGRGLAARQLGRQAEGEEDLAAALRLDPAAAAAYSTLVFAP